MSKIEWTDLTVNPLKVLNDEEEEGNYCIKVSPGCAHCYSERLNATPRFGGNKLKYRVMPLDPSQLVFKDDVMEKLSKMKKGKRVFIASMTDIFAEFWPIEYQFRLLDYAAKSPQHHFLLLTKRAEYMATIVNMWLEAHKLMDVPIHMMLGVSAENQVYFDQRVPFLAKLPARRFVSLEPLLGSIDIAKYGDWLDWVIVGGESGPGARPMQPDWARQIRNDCRVFNVPFFFKQWGETLPMFQKSEFFGGYCGGFDGENYKFFEPANEPPNNIETDKDFWGYPFEKCGTLVNVNNVPMREYESNFMGVIVGKKKSGRLLDGVEYNQFPSEVTTC